MRRRTEKPHGYKSHTLPSSPAHSSSSSSDFEFRISISPRRSSAAAATADELFYKGQLLPLHLHPRLSMVQSLLLSSPSSSSSATASRDSTASSSTTTTTTDPPDPDSSRPSSATDDDDLNRRPHLLRHHFAGGHNLHQINKKPNKYFSLSRLSSVFKPKSRDTDRPVDPAGSSVKRASATAREVIRRYVKKVKPLYEKLSQKQQQKVAAPAPSPSPTTAGAGSAKEGSISIWSARSSKDNENNGGSTLSHSFSGNLRLYPRRARCHVASCPSSMRSSPSHSGVLLRRDVLAGGLRGYADTSSMEELQSAIQGAILHCKNSLAQDNKSSVSNGI
ncbi:hypothetical protein NMG60_11025276 [Bertholletia excelsa]